MRRPAMSLAALSALLSLAASPAHAQPPQGGRGGPGREPPPFAFEACAQGSEGGACTVSFAGQQLEGTCRAFRDQRLFCLPARLPAPPEGAPPGS